MDDSDFERSYAAIAVLLRPYGGTPEVDSVPSALLSLIQLRQLALDSFISKERLLRDLDAVTSLIGEVGSILTQSEFEKLKELYSEIQIGVSRSLEAE